MHIFKTNREEQWARLEKRDRLDGRSKKAINEDKNYFFNGPDGKWMSQSKDYFTRLAYLPERSFDGWQRCCDQFFDEPLAWQDIKMLESEILAGAGGYFQEPEDDAYYVQAMFGEKWEPSTKLKLAIKTKEPIQPLDANRVLVGCGNDLACWLNAKKGEEFTGGYVRFIPEFFEEVPKYIDQRTYDSKKYIQEIVSPSVNAKIRALKSAVTRIIIFSHKPLVGDAFVDERINVAKKFFAMFEAAKDRYPEFDSFVARVLNGDV